MKKLFILFTICMASCTDNEYNVPTNNADEDRQHPALIRDDNGLEPEAYAALNDSFPNDPMLFAYWAKCGYVDTSIKRPGVKTPGRTIKRLKMHRLKNYSEKFH